MKIIAAGFVAALLLTACSKDKTTVTDSNSDSVAIADGNTEETTGKSVIPFRAVEFSPEETTKFLSNQKNDTLYVTNFFATWCGPCIREIPHFKQKMEELKSAPVKFTFISLDSRDEWDKAVKNFAEEQNISENVILLDGEKMTPQFFANNFKQWGGGAIPFTFMRKGDQTDETLGMMSESMLTDKINSFLSAK